MDVSRLVFHVTFHLKLCLSLIFQVAYIDFSRHDGACLCFCFVFVPHVVPLLIGVTCIDFPRDWGDVCSWICIDFPRDWGDVCFPRDW